MTTEKAMLDALNRPSVKKKVNDNNIRAMRKRLKDGVLSLDKQVSFLLEHGYFIRAEINWGKPKRKKKEKMEEVVVVQGVNAIADFISSTAQEQEPKCSICRIPFPCNCAKPENEAL